MEDETITKSEFAYFLKEHRKTCGFTQKKMAEQLGVGSAILFRWENVQVYPREIHALIRTIRNVTKLELQRRRGW